MKYKTTKSRHEFEKALIKRIVFSRLLKVPSDSAFLIFYGRLLEKRRNNMKKHDGHHYLC